MNKTAGKYKKTNGEWVFQLQKNENKRITQNKERTSELPNTLAKVAATAAFQINVGALFASKPVKTLHCPTTKHYVAGIAKLTAIQFTIQNTRFICSFM